MFFLSKSQENFGNIIIGGKPSKKNLTTFAKNKEVEGKEKKAKKSSGVARTRAIAQEIPSQIGYEQMKLLKGKILSQLINQVAFNLNCLRDNIPSIQVVPCQMNLSELVLSILSVHKSQPVLSILSVTLN